MPPVQAPHTRIRYRPYIDGLRGIAIIAVVLNHAKLGLSGGFIGVDVFFVISGFLISSIIIRDLRAGTFSMRGFWERRVRRIFPALFAVMLCNIIAAYFLVLYPPDYHHFGATVTAQSTFLSNVLFTLTDNYFDQTSRYSPLLHTWSLSVEEQFYVLFPLLVMACMWCTRRLAQTRASDAMPRGNSRMLVVSVFALVAISFALDIWFINIKAATAFAVPFLPQKIFFQSSYATAGFYLLFSRAWELGVGILASLLSLTIELPLLAEAISGLGIGAICVSALFFNDTTPYPGVAALLPVLGALGVIVGNERRLTKTGALLTLPALIWIGLISYSLYLWHWPIFVFANLASPAPLSQIVMLGLIMLSVALAWISYTYIETPFRKKTLIRSQKKAFIAGFSAMALLAGTGYAIEASADASGGGRIPPAASATLAFLAAADRGQAVSSCFQRAGDAAQYGTLCRIGEKGATAQPRFALWGDSHAEAMMPLFDKLGQRYSAQGVVFSGAGCVPVVGAWTAQKSENCGHENELALKYIRDNDIKIIFLVARWSLYVTGGPEGSHADLLTDASAASPSSKEAQRVLAEHLVPMLQQLASEGRVVYVVKQAPEQFEFDPRTAFYRAAHTGQMIQTAGISTSTNAAYQAPANAILGTLASKSHVMLLDPSDLLCNDEICTLWKGDQLLYLDENHLSEAGAISLEPMFSSIFETMKKGQ